MKQVGTMTEGELLQQDSAAEIKRSGKLVTVRRTLEGDSSETYFPIWVKKQSLTPTFVHPLRHRGRQNVAENDQSDFICVGSIAMLETDEFSYAGYVWEVSSAAEMESAGETVTTHCLCVRRNQQVY